MRYAATLPSAEHVPDPERVRRKAAYWQQRSHEAAGIALRALLREDLRKAQRWQADAAKFGRYARRELFQLIGAEQP